jgi:hypothetical protein
MRAVWFVRRLVRSFFEGLGLIIGTQFLALLVLVPLLVVPSAFSFLTFVVTAFVFRYLILWGFVRVSDFGSADSSGTRCPGCLESKAVQADGPGASRRSAASDALVCAVPSQDKDDGPMMTDSPWGARGYSVWAAEREAAGHPGGPKAGVRVSR